MMLARARKTFGADRLVVSNLLQPLGFPNDGSFVSLFFCFKWTLTYLDLEEVVESVEDDSYDDSDDEEIVAKVEDDRYDDSDDEMPNLSIEDTS